MKISLLLSVLLLILPIAGFTEGSVNVTSFSCDYFSVDLPEGVVPMEDTEKYTSAMENDYPGSFEACVIASDDDRKRLITILRSDTEDPDASVAASDSAIALLGSADTVVESTYGQNHCSTFSCSIDSLEYLFCYISDTGNTYCIVSTGLSSEEEQSVFESFTSVGK